MGSVAIFATQSLRAIEDWMVTTQANITGTVKNAFKESTLMYGSGIVNVYNDPTITQNGKMIAEQTLTTGHTVLNWRDGEIVNSTEDYHFAISGSGFFLVTDPKVIPAADDYSPPSSSGAYLTRDGEFHFAIIPELAPLGVTQPVLVTKEGLLVQGDHSGGGIMGNSDNIFRYITYSEFIGTDQVRPSVVEPCYEAHSGAAPVSIVDYNELSYSKFGSTVYEANTAGSVKTIINGSAGNFTTRNINPPSGDSGSFLRPKKLEASNVDDAKNLTELALLGKVYNAFTQLIKVHNTNLDELLNFIR